MTTNLYNRIVGQRSSLESLMARVPGFRGYKDMTDRREADRIIREHVVAKLNEQMDRLNMADKKLISGGDLSQTTLTQDGKMRFQTYIERVNTAAPGYSGFYDAMKVGPDELAKVYAFDAALLDYVDKIKGAVDAFSTAVGAKEKEAIAKAVNDFETVVNEAGSAFNLREEIVTGLGTNN
jgi:hypothetical protein